MPLTRRNTWRFIERLVHYTIFFELLLLAPQGITKGIAALRAILPQVQSSPEATALVLALLVNVARLYQIELSNIKGGQADEKAEQKTLSGSRSTSKPSDDS